MRHTFIKQEGGFTLVEVAVIAPIVILVLGGILALLIGLMNDNIASRGELETLNDTASALRIMEDDVKISAAFLTAKGSEFTDPYGKNGSGGAWSYKGGGGGDRVLILQTYATTRSPRDSQKAPVYINENGCSTDDILSNPALTTNTIYFVSGGSLYRRTLTDTDETTCSTQFQRQSCPPGLTSPNAICRTDDALLLANISAFDIDYYADPSSSTPLDPYPSNDPSILDTAVATKIQITVSKPLGGQTFTYERELMVNRLE